MPTEDLINNLEFEYFAILAANPHVEMSLWDFLKSRKVKESDILEYSNARPMPQEDFE